MPLTSGSHLGPYEVLGLIGAGGMGEVYKARDTRLNRTVAIKILPAALASDEQFRERFDREARAISHLDHPNICTLYDVGEQDGTSFLVMPYLEGETLEARLRKGALPLEDAIKYAIQIADALDTAHRAGIVHRDLKPGNIMLTRAGAKLLDFGLAKPSQPILGGSGPSESPTNAPTLTARGTLLGTVQYMAPEQLDGHEADFRTDVFAFGEVLYEMVTGNKAYEGTSQASVIGAIMHAEPSLMTAVRPLTPHLLEQIVTRCLKKNPDDRWQSVRDMVWALRSIDQRSEVPPTKRESWNPTYLAWAMALMGITTAVGAITWSLLRPPQHSSPPVTARFPVLPPPGATFSEAGPAVPNPAVSPDGRHIAFSVLASKGRPVIALRSLAESESRTLEGSQFSEGGGGGQGLPFWSPDSRFIGFFGDGKLKKFDVSGGGTEVISDAPQPEGGTWSQDGTIVFAANSQGGLVRVSALGGSPSPATSLDASSNEESHRWPWFLPDGRHFLFVTSPGGSVDVGSLDSPARVKLLDAESKAIYADGYILFVRQGALLAQPFDPTRLRITGEPLRVAKSVGVNATNLRAAFSASSSGVLAFRGVSDPPAGKLVWFDRSGKQVGAIGEPAFYDDLESSPDGHRLALTINDIGRTTSDIWLHDIARDLRTRLTFERGSVAQFARWSPDGASIIFVRAPQSLLDGTLIVQPSNGAADQRVLMKSEIRIAPTSWSSDGRSILYMVRDPRTAVDLWVFSLAEQKSHPVFQRELSQGYGRFSPNGHWIAYEADESGRTDVYVTPFPGPGGKWQISARGGRFPRWSRDGTELFFVAADNVLTVAALNGRAAGFEVKAIRPLFAMPANLSGRGFDRDSLVTGYPYDVSPDGQRFLAITPLEQPVEPVIVMTNWMASLRK